MLITDAKVINGNSGGPMINSEGKLVGVITSNSSILYQFYIISNILNRQCQN